MKSQLNGIVEYSLPLHDITEPGVLVPMNMLIGKEISIKFEDEIHCVDTGRKIKKTFGEGLCYDSFMNSPLASPSIIRPELSRIHEGIALRDEAWEREHHLKPHITYLSLTSGIKVGVTSERNVPYRWVDQGAVQAVIIAKTPYRQAAGLIEVSLKEFVSDKTHWQNMLKNVFTNDMSLEEKREELIECIPPEFEDFICFDEEVVDIEFPVIQYPEKVKSMKLDKVPEINKRLTGIKGQYLIFEDNTVMNLRSHTAYRITLSVGEA